MTSLYEADDLPFRTDVGDANAVRYLAAWLPPTTSGGAFRISNSCAEHAGFPPGVVDILTGTPHAIGAEARIVIESSRQHYNTERPHDCAALINHGRQAHHALDSTQAHVIGARPRS